MIRSDNFAQAYSTDPNLYAWTLNTTAGPLWLPCRDDNFDSALVEGGPLPLPLRFVDEFPKIALCFFAAHCLRACDVADFRRCAAMAICSCCTTVLVTGTRAHSLAGTCNVRSLAVQSAESV